MGQTNTRNNTQRIQKIINERFKEEEQKLFLGTVVDDSGYCLDDWKSVLEFRNWTALRILDLSNTTITQSIVTLTKMVLSSSAVCTGPTFDL